MHELIISPSSISIPSIYKDGTVVAAAATTASIVVVAISNHGFNEQDLVCS